jgi:hypothetical protein
MRVSWRHVGETLVPGSRATIPVIVYKITRSVDNAMRVCQPIHRKHLKQTFASLAFGRDKDWDADPALAFPSP